MQRNHHREVGHGSVAVGSMRNRRLDLRMARHDAASYTNDDFLRCGPAQEDDDARDAMGAAAWVVICAVMTVLMLALWALGEGIG